MNVSRIRLSQRNSRSDDDNICHCMHTARSLFVCDQLSRCCCICARMQHQYARNEGAASWQARLIITIDTAGLLQSTPGRATRTGHLFNTFLYDTDHPQSKGLWIIHNISCRVKKTMLGRGLFLRSLRLQYAAHGYLQPMSVTT